MRRTALAACLSWWGLTAACSEPSLELPVHARDALSVTLEPPESEAGAPRLFRAQIDGADGGAEPWLFRDELSKYHERALGRGEVSGPLRERAVPLRYWRDSGHLWLQPLTLLEPGARYTLALTGQGALRALVASGADVPILERIFPSAGVPLARVLVLCGSPSEVAAAEIELQPGRVLATVTPGVFGTPRAGCLSLEVVGAGLAAAAVAPPALSGALSDPSPFAAGSSAAARPECSGAPLAHGCLEVLDDRLLVTAPVDSLWLLEEPAAALVVRAHVRTELRRGLLPASPVRLVGRCIAASGEQLAFDVELETGAARRHLILNEVLANPRGAEPQSEWIELLNDSEQPASLAGSWLEDGEGRVPLPPELLAPGELVLLAASGWRSSGLDVPVAAGARVLELPSLSARGLSNGGEALLLAGPEGVVSRFPQLAAPQAGRSVARRFPSSADDDPAAFSLHGAPGASPGAPNHFDD